jgi:hypothetical protein
MISITAAQARELGAGNAEYQYTYGDWKVCTDTCTYAVWRGTSEIKYRTKQPAGTGSQMISITFTPQASTRQVHIEAWFCGARVADALRNLPDYAPSDYFDTPEVQATMLDIAQPTVDRLREHFKL